jgi:hypothetical protein
MNAGKHDAGNPMTVADLHNSLTKMDSNRQIDVRFTDNSGKVHNGIITQVEDGRTITIISTARNDTLISTE